MKHQKKGALGIIFLIANSQIVFGYTASPSLNSRCGYSIATPPNGAGVIFDESCTIAYVNPPLHGEAAVAGLAQTSNIQFCNSLKNVNQIADRTFNSMKILSTKVEEMISDFEPLDQQLLSMKLELVTAKSRMTSAKKRLDDAETQLQTMREGLRESRKSHENCVEDFSADHVSCLALKMAWDDAKNEMIRFRNGEYRDRLATANDEAEQYELSSDRFSAYNSRYSDAVAPMLEIQERLMELNLKTMELYHEYTKLEGATGQIIWSIPWDQLLEDYRRMNRNLRLNWTRLPIKEAELISTIKNQETSTELASISAIKSAVIPGAKVAGFTGMGRGDKVDIAQTQTSGASGASMVFGNSISGQIVLNLAGACPYFDDIGERTNVNIKDIANLAVTNLIYSYEVAVRRSYTASYNLSELLYKIEKKSKRGGFFSTSSAHSIINDAESTEWFTVSFDGNSSEFQYSDAEQKQLTRELKQELMDKAMAQFSILYAGSPIPQPVPQFVDSGATSSARELRKCWHHYCQAAAAVLGVANSIFGKSDAVANFHRNNRSWVTEQINGIQFVSRTSTLTFKPE